MSKHRRIIASTPIRDGSALRNLRSGRMCCPACGLPLKKTGRKYCSQTCYFSPAGWAARKPVDIEALREANRRAYIRRLTDGREAKRLEAIKRAVAEGKYREAGRTVHAKRIASGAEARRIQILKENHRRGVYARFHEASRGDGNWMRRSQADSPERIAHLQKGLITRRRLGYYWMTGENHPFYRMDPKQRKQLIDDWKIKMRQYWDDPRWHAAHFLKAGEPPNGFENRVIAFIEKYELPFRFVGDRTWWIGPCRSGGCRNPDFIHIRKGERRAILAHGKYWHQEEKLVKAEREDYLYMGWEIFILWDDTPLNADLAEKIRAFAGLG